MAEGSGKIGAGHAQAMARAGLKEIGQILPAFPGHSVQPVEEAGLAGNLTPGEISEQKGSFSDRLAEMRSATPQAEKTPQIDQER